MSPNSHQQRIPDVPYVVAQWRREHSGEDIPDRQVFIQLSGGAHTVNRELEAKARALAGLKGYVTNLAACPTAPPSCPSS